MRENETDGELLVNKSCIVRSSPLSIVLSHVAELSFQALLLILDISRMIIRESNATLVLYNSKP